jgi:hypothetical protein
MNPTFSLSPLRALRNLRTTLAALLAVAFFFIVAVRDAAAMDPISFQQAPALVGKQVYAIVSRDLREGTGWVFAGEPLTLVLAETYGKDPVTYNYVRVRTQDGRVGEVQLENLSRTPLPFNLRKPPKSARDLSLAVLEFAYPLVARMQAIDGKSRGDISRDVEVKHELETLGGAFSAARDPQSPRCCGKSGENGLSARRMICSTPTAKA